MEDRVQLLEEYKAGPDKLRDAIQAFPKEMWHYRIDENGWTIHEFIIHLADSELIGYERCRKIIAENGTELTSYQQQEWCRELNYQEQDTELALTLFELLRKMNYKLLKTTADIYWNTHTAFHADVGSMTLDDWLSIYTKHPYLHIEEMEKIHSHWKENH